MQLMLERGFTPASGNEMANDGNTFHSMRFEPVLRHATWQPALPLSPLFICA